MANELLNAGADPNIVDDMYLQTPLHLSATHGHADIAAMMMAKGADAHLKDVWGNTFVDIATSVNSSEYHECWLVLLYSFTFCHRIGRIFIINTGRSFGSLIAFLPSLPA